jgi:signal transduction histidine kinase
LLHLVDDVLDITSIDAGQVSMRLVPTDLGAVLRVSLGLVVAERERLSIRIEDEWPADAASVRADPQRLQQVLVNLLRNACKYNRHGGSIRLGYREAGDLIAVAIADDGAGIGAEQIGELFQAFKRLPQTAEVPGVGLGLVVVKMLVEQMKGRVDVDSELGRGSTFSVWLRRA